MMVGHEVLTYFNTARDWVLERYPKFKDAHSKRTVDSTSDFMARKHENVISQYVDLYNFVKKVDSIKIYSAIYSETLDYSNIRNRWSFFPDDDIIHEFCTHDNTSRELDIDNIKILTAYVTFNDIDWIGGFNHTLSILNDCLVITILPGHMVRLWAVGNRKLKRPVDVQINN